MPKNQELGWIGVDLDGTLAIYDGHKGLHHIGEPIPKMVGRVKQWLAEGRLVKIMTARAGAYADWWSDDPAEPDPQVAVDAAIKAWCLEHIGQELEVTNVKDFNMLELWDDRAIQVVANAGERVGNEPAAGGRASSHASAEPTDTERLDWLLVNALEVTDDPSDIARERAAIDKHINEEGTAQ